MAAVDAAVRLQIASDSKTIGYMEKMDDKTKGYTTDEEMERFLLGVANRLKLDMPSFQFDWSSVDAGKARAKTLLIVQSLIDEKTRGPVEEKAKPAETK